MAAVLTGAGIEHVTVWTWTLAAWLITTRAFSPSARQQLYNAIKSAAQTAGSGLVLVGSTPHGAPLTTLTHVGPGRAGGGEGWVNWHTACPACSPASPGVWEARWWGHGGLTARLHHYSDLIPPARGECRWQGRHQVSSGRGPLLTNVNTRLFFQVKNANK
jgi:hypothetical protein